MHTARAAAAAAIVALLAGGCDQNAPSRGASQDGPEVQQGAQEAAEHIAVGTVHSIDAENGRVNISHEAVESIGWPAMRMNFELADPELGASLSPGQRIEFRFRADGGTATVTEVIRAEPAAQ